MDDWKTEVAIFCSSVPVLHMYVRGVGVTRRKDRAKEGLRSRMFGGSALTLPPRREGL